MEKFLRKWEARPDSKFICQVLFTEKKLDAVVFSLVLGAGGWSVRGAHPVLMLDSIISGYTKNYDYQQILIKYDCEHSVDSVNRTEPFTR